MLTLTGEKIVSLEAERKTPSRVCRDKCEEPLTISTSESALGLNNPTAAEYKVRGVPRLPYNLHRTAFRTVTGHFEGNGKCFHFIPVLDPFTV